MATSIATLIRELREERGWSQSEFAARMGLSQTQVSDRERDRVRIKPPERKKIAEVFGLTLDEFDARWRASKIERTVGGPGIPVINRAPAGGIVDYEEYGVDSGQGFEYLDRGAVDDMLAFAVIVVGDSMDPTLQDGDYLILSPMGVPRPRRELYEGAVVFVRFTAESGRDGYTLARWFRRDDGIIELVKDNRRYRPIICDRTEIEQVAIGVEVRTQRGL